MHKTISRSALSFASILALLATFVLPMSASQAVGGPEPEIVDIKAVARMTPRLAPRNGWYRGSPAFGICRSSSSIRGIRTAICTTAYGATPYGSTPGAFLEIKNTSRTSTIVSTVQMSTYRGSFRCSRRVIPPGQRFGCYVSGPRVSGSITFRGSAYLKIGGTRQSYFGSWLTT